MGFGSLFERATIALFVGSIMVTAASCAGRAPSLDGPIAFHVVLEDGQRWTAAGVAVERGAMCATGMRHVRMGIDPATTKTLRVPVWWDILEDAIAGRRSAEVTFEVEHTCADGSGSFVTNEQWGPDVWSIVSGTGAYRDVSGGGVLSFAAADYTKIRPLDLHLVGVLEG